MQIQIDENHQIVSDQRQFALQKRGSFSEKSQEWTWSSIGHYSTLPQALEALFNYRVRVSDAKGIKEALAAFQQAHNEVKQLASQLSFKVS